MKHWKIVDILHSGRKGVRWTPVDDPKYDDIRDCDAYFNLEDIEGLKSFRFNFKHHLLYDYWDTSSVISVGIKKGQLIIETVNTIYMMEEIIYN